VLIASDVRLRVSRRGWQILCINSGKRLYVSMKDDNDDDDGDKDDSRKTRG